MLVGTQFFAYHCHHSPFGPRGTPQNLAGSKKLESHSHLAVSEWLGRADNPSVWRKMTSSTIPPRMLRHTRQLPPMPITLVQDKNWSCWWAMLKPKPKINFIDRDLARKGPDLVSGYPPLMDSGGRDPTEVSRLPTDCYIITPCLRWCFKCLYWPNVDPYRSMSWPILQFALVPSLLDRENCFVGRDGIKTMEKIFRQLYFVLPHGRPT